MDQKQDSHAVVTRPQTPIESLKQVMAGDPMKTVVSYYSGDKEKAQRFMAAAIEYVRRVPKLLECDRTSLVMAFVQSAQFNFLPSGVGGEAYVIPYGKDAKFQIGYQGYVTLFYRAGVKSVKALIIYENDKWEYAEGLDTTLVHVPTAFGKPKGDPIGVYAVAVTPNGGRVFKVMSKDEVMAIKDLSKAKNTKDSPWNSDKDPELWMWKKTCLIQLSKLLPKSAELIQAVAVDYEGEGIDRPNLDAGGAAVGSSFHEPEKTLPKEPEGERDPEKCKAGLHHVDFEDDKGNCTECAKEKKGE
jgi:recombination protein RecT